MTDRAVSEVIAFILVFSIVITSVGLLYSVGFGSLNQIQATEQDRSGEQAMRAVAVALDDIHRDRGTIREVSIDLAGRPIFVDTSEEMSADVGGAPIEASGALVYGAGGDTEIAYVGGGVVRSQGEESQVMSREPRFQCAEDHAVVSLVELVDQRNGSVSSSDSVEIEAERLNPEESRLERRDTSGTENVSVQYDGAYQTAFDRYIDAHDNWHLDGPGQYECDPSGPVYVRKTVIDVEYKNV